MRGSCGGAPERGRPWGEKFSWHLVEKKLWSYQRIFMTEALKS